MRDWLLIQQIYDECSRARTLGLLLTQHVVSFSGLALLICVLFGLSALAVAPLVTEGWWTPAVVVAVVLLSGLLGGLVLEDRAMAVIQAREGSHRHNALMRRYRRGMLGPRYALFRERLQEHPHLTTATLESALTCCDAEREMRRRGYPAASTGPAVLALLAAFGLLAAVPFVAEHGFAALAQWSGLALAAIASLLLAWRAAQPALSDREELRCMLVWALEDARTETPDQDHLTR
ncbi:hypothetical protein [Aquisalimonas asiatica]|uniref:Uncharacterized protein n=1 Tax=Aquisalimonas asiatica TaxID=406100 RepID=A0A1H8PK93_9GAMM|nr:hypothetical protein [Aquisalimonas asiatica]SEO42372.1 hypothetical protein SAMN04488052_1019 [Aquisalimonas asiatica]